MQENLHMSEKVVPLQRNYHKYNNYNYNNCMYNNKT